MNFKPADRATLLGTVRRVLTVITLAARENQCYCIQKV
ncbi:hypothetical protein RKLH11_2400 [Rhodobacteraceae bacterium KLH11]|nr:hypothetical protein RKLH11_2400 [Rhodobacteraceae bacterium KLH11]